MKVDLLGATASDFQEMLDAGTLTSVDLVRQCHQQMLDHNGRLKAMISISPLSYTERVAKDLDKERQNGHRRSPLHGIPLIVKVVMASFTHSTLVRTNTLAGLSGYYDRLRIAIDGR